MTTILPEHVIDLIQDFRLGTTETWKTKYDESLFEIADNDPDKYIITYFTLWDRNALINTIDIFIKDVVQQIPSRNNKSFRKRLIKLVVHELVRRQVKGYEEIKQAFVKYFPIKDSYDRWHA